MRHVCHLARSVMVYLIVQTNQMNLIVIQQVESQLQVTIIGEYIFLIIFFIRFPNLFEPLIFIRHFTSYIFSKLFLIISDIIIFLTIMKKLGSVNLTNFDVKIQTAFAKLV